MPSATSRIGSQIWTHDGVAACARWPRCVVGGSIPQYDAEERVVDLQAAVVLNEAELPKLV